MSSQSACLLARLGVALLGIALASASAIVAPSAAARAADDEPLAPERYNGFFEIGGLQSSGVLLGSALSEHGAFRAWTGGSLYSTVELNQRQGLDNRPWARASITHLPRTGTAVTASASGDYAVVAGAVGVASRSGGVLYVETVAAGATSRESFKVRPLRPAGDTSATAVRVDVAADGPDVYALVVHGSPTTPAQAIELLRSRDRGVTWEPAIALDEVAGLADAGGIPVPTIAVDGPRVAVLLDDSATTGSRRALLVSADKGDTWSVLDDPAPQGERSPLGLGWRNGTLRAAWVARGDDGLLRVRTVVRSPGDAGWSGEEEVPGDALAEGALVTAPLVRSLGSAWAVQPASGLLRTRWPAGWLRVNKVQARTLPQAQQGSRLLYEYSAFVADNDPPTISLDGPFSRWQRSADDPPRIYVTDEGYLRSVECTLDGVRQERPSATYPSCPSPAGRQRVGEHTLRIDAEDAAGNVSSRTVTWQVDATAPVARFTAAPKRWLPARTRGVIWRWTASDDRSGVASTSASLEAGSWDFGGLPVARRTRAAIATSAWRGGSVCAIVSATDRAHNFSLTAPRCATTPVDDGLLTVYAPPKQVSGKAYDGGRATELGSRTVLALDVSEQRRVTGVAIRALTCPSCGAVRVAWPGKRFTLSLRTSHTGVRVIQVPWVGRSVAPRIRLTRIGSRRAVVDGLYVETTSN